MNNLSGFRGTRLGIRSLTIRGSFVEFSLLFLDEEGMTHGHCDHRVPIADHSSLADAATALLEACLDYSASKHFTDYQQSNSKEPYEGIAEILGISDNDEPG